MEKDENICDIKQVKTMSFKIFISFRFFLCLQTSLPIKKEREKSLLAIEMNLYHDV